MSFIRLDLFTYLFMMFGFVSCNPKNSTEKTSTGVPAINNMYEVQSIIIRNAVAFVFLLAALSFSRASLGVVFFLSQLCRFEVATSVPLSQP